MTTPEDRGTYLEHDGRPAVRFERRFAQPAERVWRAVTDPAELKAWFPSPEVSYDARTGGAISLSGDPYAPDGTTGQVLVWDPPHRFGFEWGGDQLFLTVTPDGDGCRLVLLDVLDSEGGAARNATGWTMCLAALERSVTGSAAEHEFRPLLAEYVAAGLPDDGWLPDGLPEG
jgi:uncharacterized protein YndB with AHSA1/START domain